MKGWNSEQLRQQLAPAAARRLEELKLRVQKEMSIERYEVLKPTSSCISNSSFILFSISFPCSLHALPRFTLCFFIRHACFLLISRSFPWSQASSGLPLPKSSLEPWRSAGATGPRAKSRMRCPKSGWTCSRSRCSWRQAKTPRQPRHYVNDLCFTMLSAALVLF